VFFEGDCGALISKMKTVKIWVDPPFIQHLIHMGREGTNVSSKPYYERVGQHVSG